MLSLVASMVHPHIVHKIIVSIIVKLIDVESDVVPKVIMYMDVKLVDVEVDVGK